MIGCLLIPAAPDEALRALRLRLEQLSPRVQPVAAGPEVALLLDLGRGTAADGRRHALALEAAAVCMGEGARADHEWLARPRTHEGSRPRMAGAATNPRGERYDAFHRAAGEPPGAPSMSLAYAVRVGVAPAPTLAHLAAALAAPGAPVVLPPGAVGAALARCPVAWLAPLEPLALALAGLGLRTLADLAALPGAAVGGRFGPAALAAWRALHGDEPPLRPLPSPPRLRARRRFDGPVADRGALALAVGRLAGRLAAGLERRGLAARALALHLHAEAAHPCAAGRTLERPAATAAALAPVAAALLERAIACAAGLAAGLGAGASGATLEMALGAGVSAVELVAGELVAPRGEQLPLFGAAPGRRAEALAALDDLAARVGPGALLRAAPQGADPPRLVPWGAV